MFSAIPPMIALTRILLVLSTYIIDASHYPQHMSRNQVQYTIYEQISSLMQYELAFMMQLHALSKLVKNICRLLKLPLNISINSYSRKTIHKLCLPCSFIVIVAITSLMPIPSLNMQGRKFNHWFTIILVKDIRRLLILPSNISITWQIKKTACKSCWLKPNLFIFIVAITSSC